MLHGISTTAAGVGAKVMLFGEGFEKGASVRVGKVDVPAADILAVDAHSVQFRTSAALPELGQVRVTSGGKETESTRIYLAKTKPWAPTSGPPSPTDLVRGTNKLTIPGIDVKKDGILLLPGEPTYQITPNPTQLKMTPTSSPVQVNVDVPRAGHRDPRISSWRTANCSARPG